jgi:hypothetical protein
MIVELAELPIPNRKTHSAHLSSKFIQEPLTPKVKFVNQLSLVSSEELCSIFPYVSQLIHEQT